ncbi:hypothetical protein D3C81_1635240 [compost metagenome]
MKIELFLNNGLAVSTGNRLLHHMWDKHLLGQHSPNTFLQESIKLLLFTEPYLQLGRMHVNIHKSWVHVQLKYRDRIPVDRQQGMIGSHHGCLQTGITDITPVHHR